jgi:hypothetical protein
MSLRQEVRQFFAHRTMAVVIASGAVITSTALVVGGWKATHAPEGASAARRTLDVTGYASRHLTPNHATWTITLHGHADDKDGAIAAARESGEGVHAWLTAHGFTENELAFALASATLDESTVTRHTSDGTAYEQDQSTGFDASLAITVETTDIARILQASHAAGIAEELQGAEAAEPACTAADSDKLEQALLADARQGAHAKARAALQDYGGVKLGKLLTANVGTFEVSSTCTDVVASATTSGSYEIE